MYGSGLDSSILLLLYSPPSLLKEVHQPALYQCLEIACGFPLEGIKGQVLQNCPALMYGFTIAIALASPNSLPIKKHLKKNLEINFRL